jgi:hypothetical protein
MLIYRHLSGAIVEVHEGSPQLEVYSKSPSWKQVVNVQEENKEESLLSILDKSELIDIAKNKQLETSVHNTNKEIIERIESKTKKYEVSSTKIFFTDNLL